MPVVVLAINVTRIIGAKIYRSIKDVITFDRLKYVYYRSLDIAFEGFKSGQLYFA